MRLPDRLFRTLGPPQLTGRGGRLDEVVLASRASPACLVNSGESECGAVADVLKPGIPHPIYEQYR
nr:hypothetical protein PCFP21_205 [Curtobacterium flaccumfaciens pv. poinsettiae]WQM79209.1 hypothetical protein PCFP23_300 [Curtobacterium flaccumfaciens pv. poinsettiae]WQM79327.1 hypothetical protein PCFP24_385 [Curtobacterium flaccumfaciens pv. poinsettiae]WQM79401.1 hypothetical protein PCFP11_270 [Curtobacterium flaccumfaciens pv. poinsettiae]WQM79437.1 hypothetical protein PCFP31_015 [Curtobacterium flaccumfaciens pv. poinsettiae]